VNKEFIFLFFLLLGVFALGYLGGYIDNKSLVDDCIDHYETNFNNCLNQFSSSQDFNSGLNFKPTINLTSVKE